MTLIEQTNRPVHFDYSDAAIAQQTSVIVTQLTEQLIRDGENIFLLIDPAILELNASSLWIKSLTERHPEPIPLPHSSIPQSYYPWLVPLDITQPNARKLLEESIAKALQETDPAALIAGSGRAICGWLTSAQPIHVVARQVGSTAVQALSGGGNILLRYFDPAVNSVLWPQLSAFQQRRLMGVISGWHLLNGDGQLVSRQHSASPLPFMTFSLGLAAKDNLWLEQTAVLNKAMRQYREMNRALPRRHESALLNIMQQALQRMAHSPIISEPAEQILFALHTLRWHALIDLHPEFQYLMSLETHPVEVGYSQRIQKLSQQDWQRFAAECDRLSPSTTQRNKELLP